MSLHASHLARHLLILKGLDVWRELGQSSPLPLLPSGPWQAGKSSGDSPTHWTSKGAFVAPSQE